MIRAVPSYTFDAANRLVSSSRDDATVQPVYNGVGDRVRQPVGATTTYYTLDVEGLPEVITSDGEIYLHLPGVIVTEKASQVRYLLGDDLGINGLSHSAALGIGEVGWERGPEDFCLTIAGRATG